MKVCPDCGASYAEIDRFCQTDGQQLVDSPPDPLLGERIGNYRITRVLGSGGMGRVYLAAHPRIGSRVAIKVLSPECAERRDLVDRFFAEARAVNHVRHEGIVNILDLATLPDGRPYIVMEYLDGRPLSDLIAATGPLPLASLCQMMIEILDALGHAHDKGVVHRDLKPDNVFITPHGRPKLLDFGIAKLLPDFGGEMARATRTGVVLGTPAYMAPEQIVGGAITPATDLYSVGIMLFEAATGRPPFGGESLFALLQQHVTDVPLSPRSLRPEIPPDLEQIILTALAKDARERFATAPAMAQALAQVARALPHAAWGAIGARQSAAISSPPPISLAGPAAYGAPAPAAPLPPAPGDTRRDPVPAFLESPAVPDSANDVHRAAGAPALVAEARRTGARTIAITSIAAVAAVVGIIVAAVMLRDGDGGEVEVDAVQEAAAEPADQPAKEAASEPAKQAEAEAEAEPTAAPTEAGKPTTVEPTQAAPAPAAAPAADPAAPAEPTKVHALHAPILTAPPSPPPDPAAAPAASPAAAPAASPTATPAATPVAAPSARAADPKPVSDKAESAVTFINTSALASQITGIKPMSLPSEWSGGKRFDAIAFLPRAQKLARQLMSDAFLVQFEVEAVHPDGRSDMRYGTATFWFRSPSRSARPAGVPHGVEVDIACMVYVEVSAKAIEVYPVTREECTSKKRPTPRCTLAQVWQRAISHGARGQNVVATINYLWDGWTLGVGDDEFYESFPDDC